MDYINPFVFVPEILRKGVHLAENAYNVSCNVVESWRLQHNTFTVVNSKVSENLFRASVKNSKLAIYRGYQSIESKSEETSGERYHFAIYYVKRSENADEFLVGCLSKSEIRVFKVRFPLNISQFDDSKSNGGQIADKFEDQVEEYLTNSLPELYTNIYISSYKDRFIYLLAANKNLLIIDQSIHEKEDFRCIVPEVELVEDEHLCFSALNSKDDLPTILLVTLKNVYVLALDEDFKVKKDPVPLKLDNRWTDNYNESNSRIKLDLETETLILSSFRDGKTRLVGLEINRFGVVCLFESSETFEPCSGEWNAVCERSNSIVLRTDDNNWVSLKYEIKKKSIRLWPMNPHPFQAVNDMLATNGKSNSAHDRSQSIDWEEPTTLSLLSSRGSQISSQYRHSFVYFVLDDSRINFNRVPDWQQTKGELISLVKNLSKNEWRLTIIIRANIAVNNDLKETAKVLIKDLEKDISISEGNIWVEVIRSCYDDISADTWKFMTFNLHDQAFNKIGKDERERIEQFNL